ncbi:hypothetical protein LMG32289_06464 [Cupriavidus pampae]|uniref:Uncharacterized protein n=2 Tax=Cupriavidus pampae TaxID=659251 RepID=A0ABM8Y181_9BURK|nr:hypothetical protein LMG32289_06464 [Cupriavidus pampae]
MARQAKASLQDISGTSNLIGGPWFSQNGDQPVEGLPTVDKAHTSYREELAVSGILVGSVIGAVTVYRFGASADSVNSFMSYLGASTFGAMIFWWLGGLLGGRIARLSLSRKQTDVPPNEILMITSCDSASKEVTKRIIHDLGGVSIDEHKDLMPNFRWV